MYDLIENSYDPLYIIKYCSSGCPLRENPHMFYTPSFTLFHSRKGEIWGTQNKGLFSDLDRLEWKKMSQLNNTSKNK